MEEREPTIALGPVGAVGLVLIAAAVVKRSVPLALLGGAAVWADVSQPGLRGFASTR